MQACAHGLACSHARHMRQDDVFFLYSACPCTEHAGSQQTVGLHAPARVPSRGVVAGRRRRGCGCWYCDCCDSAHLSATCGIVSAAVMKCLRTIDAGLMVCSQAEKRGLLLGAACQDMRNACMHADGRLRVHPAQCGRRGVAAARLFAPDAVQQHCDLHAPMPTPRPPPGPQPFPSPACDLPRTASAPSARSAVPRNPTAAQRTAAGRPPLRLEIACTGPAPAGKVKRRGRTAGPTPTQMALTSSS